MKASFIIQFIAIIAAESFALYGYSLPTPPICWCLISPIIAPNNKKLCTVRLNRIAPHLLDTTVYVEIYHSENPAKWEFFSSSYIVKATKIALSRFVLVSS